MCRLSSKDVGYKSSYVCAELLYQEIKIHGVNDMEYDRVKSNFPKASLLRG